MAALEHWLALRQVAFVEEPPGVIAAWARFGASDHVAPKCWMDAYLAAVAVAGGWRLLTFDRDVLSFQTRGLDLALLPPAP